MFKIIKPLGIAISKIATGQFVGDLLITITAHILRSRLGLKVKNKVQDTLEIEGANDIQKGFEKMVKSSTNKVDDKIVKVVKSIGLIK